MNGQTRKINQRLIALLLCLVMMLSLLPTSVLATGSSAEETIYVLAGGDFQEAGDSANSAENVRNILAQVSQKYSTMNGFLFVGDYDCDTHNDANATADGITALMGAVQGKYSNLNYENSVLVQGNHDYKDSRIDATGGHDMDVNGDGTYDYSAYVLNEDDYPNEGGSPTGIQTLANNLKTWLNNKIGEGYDRPVFIVSHLPLAFTPRTVTQGDAKYAKYIFDVLNDAGKNGLNIIFLHGHDHAFGPDNYMGGEAIYLPVGDKICIAEAGSSSAWTEETLNFTYMNAGYTGYYSDPYTYVTTAGTDKLTMTVFAITDNQVTVERYSEDGLYNLKSAGYDGSYSNTSVTNVSLGLPKYSAVYASPQTITLVDNGAADMGTIGQWVGIAAETPADDVTTSNKGWVELIAPVPGTEATGGTHTYTLDTDGIDAGSNNKYIIVARNQAYALYSVTATKDTSNNTVFDCSAPAVTINGNTVTTTTRDYEYYFTGSGEGLITKDGTSSLYQVNYDVDYGNNPGNAGLDMFTNLGNGYYRIYDGEDTPRSLYFDGTRWTVTRTDHTNNTYSVRLYKYTGTTGGTGGGSIYAKIKGELSYTVSSTTTAEEAMATVKAGIDGYRHEAMSAPSSDVAGTKVDDGALKWEWADAYQMGVPGDYAIKISYTYNGADYELGVAEVVVPAATTYYAAEGNGLYLVDMNTTEANAMAAVKDGVTVYSATDANGTGKEAISDNDVTWKWVDKYNGADSGPYTVEILKDGTSLGTVEVKVNIKYETGINSGWTYIGETEATGGTHTYTLDTDGIDAGSDNMYIIVARDRAYLLDAGSAVAVEISSDGKTITTSTRDYEYYFTGSTGGKITRDGTSTLYQKNWLIHTGYEEKANLDAFIDLHNGYYRLYDNDAAYRALFYIDGTYHDATNTFTVTDDNDTPETSSTDNTYSVRLYKYTGTTGGTPAGSVYALIEGNTVYTVTQGSSATKALAAVKAGITGFTATDANGNGKTEIADSDLTWKWKNTFNGNSTGSYWVEISYQGKVLGTVEVKVEPGVVNNYPEYPDEGSVKVNKTGTGIDFQSSGIAQVELSASGVPIKKGADVIVMLDTSSSMQTHTVTGTNQTRAEVLEESLTNLIAQFKTPGADGQLLDIRVAIADFNGFYGDNHSDSGTAYDRDAADKMSDGISYTADSKAMIYTGDGTLGAGAFIPVEDLAASYTLNYTAGTNYDYAFDAIYQMGTAIKEASGSEDRDLYVIFMSDGAAMQWNYYHSQGASSLWNNWITGAWDAANLTSSNLNCTEHAYYYDEVDHNGDGMKNEHRMANAIKGDPAEQFEVIRKVNTLGTSTGETNMYMVPGLGAKMFSISFDAQADTNVTEESMDKSIASLASEQKYYYKVTTADELTNAFAAIGSEIAYAAYNARFVDQMGDDYNLQMAVRNYTVVDGSSTTGKTITPKIEIISYDIYQASEVGTTVNGVSVTSDMVGNRKGTYTVLETVTFNNDGTEAYSDKKAGNILIGGVIYAQSFWYNTNANSVAVEGVSIPTGTKSDGTTTGSTNMLPSETFYWKMGTVQTSELAMRYYVYLTGSMEGTRDPGSYPTNESATLYYTNWLGNEAKKDTVSPVLAWKSAHVSYAFYLVNDEGEIIVNQSTGTTGSFANKIALTNPVVAKEVLLNSGADVNASVVAKNVLPTGYTLYDPEAAYTVLIKSNSTGSWTVTGGDGVTPATTYVTEYGGEPTTASTGSNNSYDYTHTVVWFAVKYEVKCMPDTVVIDYGLPVDIHVLKNDMFYGKGELQYIGAVETDGSATGDDTSAFTATDYAGKYGTAKVIANGQSPEESVVRYTPNTMQMADTDQFSYAVAYSGTPNAGYYYGTVTVIPATTIYYEDSFVTFEDGSQDGEPTMRWTQEGTTTEATQAEDRPGQFSLSSIDANNVYGYDQAYQNCSQYSLGSAKKVTLNMATSNNVVWPTAQFTFCGTGFDLISVTSGETGTIRVRVYEGTSTAKADKVKDWTVDTYYGYEYKDGAWVVTDNSDTLYQIPVIKGEGLKYGTYTVVVTPYYYSAFDHTGGNDASYDFYLDAIRIYDPAGKTPTNPDIRNAYKADQEYAPDYAELRNLLIQAGDFDATTEAKNGIVFVDGYGETNDMAQYTAAGPNNEVYLKRGQAIAFDIWATEKPDSVQLGMKLVQGTSATVNVGNSNATDSGSQMITTATDLYYTITQPIVWSPAKSKDGYYKTEYPIVITNASDSDAIVSLTNVKWTFSESGVGNGPTRTQNTVKLMSTAATAPAAYHAVRSVLGIVDEPEVFQPEQMELNWKQSSVTTGRKATLTITTSSDVTAITVNGEALNQGKLNRRTGLVTWTYTVTAGDPGVYTYEVVASNADGLTSEPMETQLSVTPRKTLAEWFDALFDWIWRL